MSNLDSLNFYSTREHPCSYLEGKQAKTIFADPEYPLDGHAYSQLSEYGFRRSGPHVYRPACTSCNACVPIRIPTDRFSASRSQKRCLKRNQDLRAFEVQGINTSEHYALYEQYINQRHADGDMYPPSRTQYTDFLTSEWGITRYFELRDSTDKLIGVSVSDQLDHGLSAVYFFFDPSEEKRSLGRFNILFQIDWCRENGLPYVFLGYWIRDCRKMTYKTEYQPFQVYVQNAWITVSDLKKNPS